jgi:hypothetical protein
MTTQPLKKGLATLFSLICAAGVATSQEVSSDTAKAKYNLVLDGGMISTSDNDSAFRLMGTGIESDAIFTAKKNDVTGILKNEFRNCSAKMYDNNSGDPNNVLADFKINNDKLSALGLYDIKDKFSAGLGIYAKRNCAHVDLNALGKDADQVNTEQGAIIEARYKLEKPSAHIDASVQYSFGFGDVENSASRYSQRGDSSGIEAKLGVEFVNDEGKSIRLGLKGGQENQNYGGKTQNTYYDLECAIKLYKNLKGKMSVGNTSTIAETNSNDSTINYNKGQTRFTVKVEYPITFGKTQ